MPQFAYILTRWIGPKRGLGKFKSNSPDHWFRQMYIFNTNSLCNTTCIIYFKGVVQVWGPVQIPGRKYHICITTFISFLLSFTPAHYGKKQGAGDLLSSLSHLYVCQQPPLSQSNLFLCPQHPGAENPPLLLAAAVHFAVQGCLFISKEILPCVNIEF